MLVHIQTVTQSTFAFVGDDGNIVETRVANAVVPVLTQKAFDQVFIDICAAREQLKQDFSKGSG